jgi:3-deoxy-D-manno-octulosonate 8-phosphate phosphatase (KDO 8-P phosphatase)
MNITTFILMSMAYLLMAVLLLMRRNSSNHEYSWWLYSRSGCREIIYNVYIISGSNEGVGLRLRRSWRYHWYLFRHFDKVETFDECTVYNINPEQVLYMGDDIPDYHVMKLVGLPTCPQDASPWIKGICSAYIA